MNRTVSHPHRSPWILSPIVALGACLSIAHTASAQVFIATDEVMVIPDPTLVDKLYLLFRNNPPGWFLVHHPFLSTIFTIAIVAWAMNRERESREDSTTDVIAMNVAPGWEPAMAAEPASARPAWQAGNNDSLALPKPITMGDANPVSRPTWMAERDPEVLRHL